jgi:hypothetical protein
MPQALPVEQEPAGAELNEKELPPLIFEAKVEIFFWTLGLLQLGQTTLSVALALKTSSSKSSWQSVHANSKIGIFESPKIFYFDMMAHTFQTI